MKTEEEKRENYRKAALARWAKPGAKEAQSIRVKEVMMELKNDPAFIRKINIEDKRKAANTRWAKPGEKEKQIEIGRKVMTELNADPEFRRKINLIASQPKSESTKRKLSILKSGTILSETHKQNIGKGVRRFFETVDDSYREAARAVACTNYINQLHNRKPTSIEMKVKSILDQFHIEYKFQKRIHNYVVDFLIDNVVIEVDGYFWHNRPGSKEKDRLRDIKLRQLGYQVIRLKEKDINKNAFALVVQTLISIQYFISRG